MYRSLEALDADVEFILDQMEAADRDAVRERLYHMPQRVFLNLRRLACQKRLKDIIHQQLAEQNITEVEL